MDNRPVKIVFCWMGISGYMAACWRAISREPGVSAFVIATPTHRGFDSRIMHGVDHHMLTEDEASDSDRISAMVRRHSPDVLVLPGWAHDPYIRLAFDPPTQKTRLIMGMDTPLKFTLRQRLARMKIGRYLDRLDAVFVPGERAWQYARQYLKIPESKLRRGLYGIDFDGFSSLYERRLSQPGGWPRRFLFTGRYDSVKALDVLMEGYSHYRKMVKDPWPLTCCGQGTMQELVRRTEGVEDRGFVQPDQQGEVYASHGVFVIVSRYDPWPLVVVEACAAGMPVIHSEACGSGVELVRPYYNGRGVATEDPVGLARAMHWMHCNVDQLPAMGRRGMELASAYSAQMWSRRWTAACRELVMGREPAARRG